MYFYITSKCEVVTLLFSVSSVDLTSIISVRDLALLTQKPGKTLLLTIARSGVVHRLEPTIKLKPRV